MPLYGFLTVLETGFCEIQLSRTDRFFPVATYSGGFITLKQHSKGNKPNISAFAIFNIHSNTATYSTFSNKNTSLDPTHSAKINPFYSLQYSPGNLTNNTTHSAGIKPFHSAIPTAILSYGREYPGIRAPTCPRRHIRSSNFGSQSSSHDSTQHVLWATTNHPPPPIILTDLLVSYPTSSSIHISSFLSPHTTVSKQEIIQS